MADTDLSQGISRASRSRSRSRSDDQTVVAAEVVAAEKSLGTALACRVFLYDFFPKKVVIPRLVLAEMSDGTVVVVQELSP